MKKIKLYFIIFMVLSINLLAQVEHVPVFHPVYSFLIHAETLGMLPHYSLSSLPLQRLEIVSALRLVRDHAVELNAGEIASLETFETEFEITPRANAVVFYSDSDSAQVLSSRFISNDEKFIYHYRDSLSSASLEPLGSVEALVKTGSNSRNIVLGNLGIRLHGTIKSVLGYYLQATNGVIISGDRTLALEDTRLAHNVKFAYYNSDFDFTESHVRFQYDWFYATIGRETRLVGAGLNQRLFLSSNAPATDALSLGARFSGFEYRFTHGSLLAMSDSTMGYSVAARLPSKYMATHRFALRPVWGELAFWENIIYSGRNLDLAYLNPLSFMKSVEHSLHDRDNSMMGADLTVRPVNGLLVKASYLLDDVMFSQIGKGHWSNKTAWNIAIITSPGQGIDFGVEYSRVEPYTFTHFNPQNSMTSDSLLIGGYLLPNSDQASAMLQWWWGSRYPIELRADYTRHGKNIYDENGNLIKNAGADPLIVKRAEDAETVVFLDGKRQNTVSLSLQAGWEVIRGFNFQGIYTLRNTDGQVDQYLRLIFRFGEF